ncbi:hypothetical protein EP56_15120 [Listeriaceae bacterium FSL A5-0209]|nr:hypothetical protein EP56_15120 [Listeriaceae bacterium FSL A5-0209]
MARARYKSAGEALAAISRKIGTRAKLEFAEEYCNSDTHPLKTNIQKIIVGGAVLCPICESIKNSAIVSEQQSKIHAHSEKKRVQDYLFQNSLLTDKSLFQSGFKNFIAEDVSSEEYVNKNKAIEAYKQYDAGEAFNTLLVGSPGAGKSHLAMAIARSLNEKKDGQAKCLFIKVDDLMSAIRETFRDDYQGGDGERYYTQMLINADFLVLDDLGAESGSMTTSKQATNFVHRILYAVLDGRQETGTIITSNLALDEMVDIYDTKIISRLFRNKYVIDFSNIHDKRVGDIVFKKP